MLFQPNWDISDQGIFNFGYCYNSILPPRERIGWRLRTQGVAGQLAVQFASRCHHWYCASRCLVVTVWKWPCQLASQALL